MNLVGGKRLTGVVDSFDHQEVMSLRPNEHVLLPGDKIVAHNVDVRILECARRLR